MKNRGFTLIELLVVIAIIGVLSSVILASLNSARAKGSIAAAQSNLQAFIPTWELYLESHTTYPPNADDCSGCSNPCDATQWNAVVNELKASGVMANPPALDPWGHAWCYDNNYKVPFCTAPTKIWSMGPNGSNETTYDQTNFSGDDIGVVIAGPQC